MDIFPIWKTSYYPTTESDAVFRIMKWGTQEIYKGRGRRYPDGNYLDINLNRSTQNTLDSMIWEALGASGDTVALSNGYAEFSLDFYDSSTDIWTTVYQFAMVNDWSYEEHEGNVYSEPINGHACPGMVLPYSYLVTGDTAETICYEEWDMNPHITLSPSAITFGYGDSYWEVYVTSNTDWNVKSHSGKFTFDKTSGHSGTTKVTVHATKNESAFDVFGEIVFEVMNQYGRDTATLSIKQNGAMPYFTITSGGTVSFDGRPATWVITYETNIVPAYWVMENSNYEIIASGYTSGGTLMLPVPESESGDTYYVHFSKNDHSYWTATATATQAPAPVPVSITILPASMTVFGGGTVTITIDSTEDWTATPPAGITMSQTSGTSGTTTIMISFDDVSGYTTTPIQFTTNSDTVNFTLYRYPEGSYTGFTENYLVIKITSNGTLKFSSRVNYFGGGYPDFDWATGYGYWYWSKDSGATWNSVFLNGVTTATTYIHEIEVTAGEEYWVSGNASHSYHFPGTQEGGYKNIGGTAQFTVSGDPRSLYGPGVACLSGMFKNSNVTNAEDLIINADSGVSCQYYAMFSGCTMLRTPPREITSKGFVYPYCFADMFKGSGVWSIPNINITAMDGDTFINAFMGCNGLNRVTLPNITLSDRCYAQMFANCENLVYVDIQSTTLAKYSLYKMFKNCTSLISVHLAWRYGSKPVGATDEWLYNVGPSGILYNSAGVSNWPKNSASNNYSGIPARAWQIQSY